MFDLFRSRAKAVRILLGVLLGMVALSMLVYLIPGAGAPVGNRDDQVVAEVGKDAISVHEVELQIQTVLKGRKLPPDMVSSYIPQLVDQVITDHAIAYEAKRLGFEVSDKDLAFVVRSMPNVAGRPPEQYKMFVEQMGMTIPEFENNLRDGIYENSIQNIALEGAIVTPAEVEAEYRKRNEKIKIEYIGFDPMKLKAEVKATPQEVQGYFDKNKGFFTVPESRSVQLIVADQAKVTESMQIPDSQVQQYYNSHKDQFRTPERVKVRHILLGTTNKPKDEVPKIKAKAEDLLKQIKGGADFAKLAEKYSEDPGSAKNGGDLGWVVRGQMVKNFEEATFSLKPKEISSVVTTEYGFHILQVLEKEPAHLRSLDEVRNELVAGLKNQSVFDRMQNLTDQARAELVKAPQNAQQIAGKLGLVFLNIDRFVPSNPLPGIGADPQIAAAIAALQKNEVSQVLQSNNRLAIAVVTGLNPPHPPTLAEVEPQARDQYAQQRAVQLTAEKSQKAASMVKSNGGDLKAAAKSFGVEVKTTDFFSRNGAAEGIGSASYLGDGFNKPLGTVLGPINVGVQTVVVKIVDKVQADMSKLPQEREGIVSQLKSKKSGERQILFQDSVLTRLIQEGKIKKHNDVINRLMGRYRS